MSLELKTVAGADTDALQCATTSAPTHSDPSSSSEATVPAVLSAGSQVMALLSQVAGWGLGLAAFAYVSGQREMSAYLDALEAPWAMALFSPTQLMQVGARPASIVVAAGFMAVRMLLWGVVTEKRLRQVAWALLILATGCLIIGNLWIARPAVAYGWTVGWSILMAMGGGVTAAVLVANVSRGHGWVAEPFGFLDLIVLVALVGTGNFLGFAHAMADAEPGTSNLPLVTLTAPSPDAWRLAVSNGDKLLLVRLANTPAERRFRIVSATDVATIGAQAPRVLKWPE